VRAAARLLRSPGCALAAAVGACLLGPGATSAHVGGAPGVARVAGVAQVAQVAQVGQVARVAVATGALQGEVVSGGRQWLGVPYAAPPTGRLRWRPPAPAQSWRGVRRATHFAPSCLQASTQYDVAQGSENCLYLNVYAPGVRPGERPLPVTVWLHGGGFVNGSANDFDGRFLAATARAIVVTVNYRLGPFGWLALKSLEQHGASGNYGLMDQVAALRWVRANIAAFGGNPRDVLLFGQSAGGESVLAQLASPLAAGLFERAEVESAPTALALPTMAAAESRNDDAYAKSLGCPDPARQAACLRAVPAGRALAAAHEDMDLIRDGGLYWTPVTGTPALPSPWLDAFRAGRFNKVPVMIGNTRHEGRLFAAIYENDLSHPLTVADLAGPAAAYGSAAASILAEYDPADYPSTFAQTSDLITDSAIACSNEVTRGALLAGGAPAVYSWEFTDPRAFDVEVVGRYHAVLDGHDSNLPFLFQWNPGHATRHVPPFTRADRVLATEMGRYWGDFARTGDPNGPGLPRWHRWRAGTGSPTEELAPGGARAMAPGIYYDEHKCGFWEPLEQNPGLP
jgi:para-nitrobenzyl esterase